MTAIRIYIQKDAGVMTWASREVFREHWAALGDGEYTVTIEAGKRGYTPTRYKYYFDCVLFEILRQAGQHFQEIDPDTAEMTRIDSTAKLHEIMKGIFNPIHVRAAGITMLLPGSTTDLSDSEFIGTYLEQIIAEFAGMPYLVEIPMYEEWKALRKIGAYDKSSPVSAGDSLGQ